MMTKPTLRITRTQLTDFECAAMNDPDCKPILDKMKADYELVIDEVPETGTYYPDMSINFMYPHRIKLLDILGVPPLSDEEVRNIFHEEHIKIMASFATLDVSKPHFDNIRKAMKNISFDKQ